jgi:hypothetical protein
VFCTSATIIRIATTALSLETLVLLHLKEPKLLSVKGTTILIHIVVFLDTMLGTNFVVEVMEVD